MESGDSNDNAVSEEPAGLLSTIIGTVLITPIMTIVVLVVVLPLALYQAWVLTILWGWFVIPVFNVAPLQFGYAYGLLLILYLLNPPVPKKRKNEFSLGEAYGVGIVGPTCSLAVGWLVKTFLCA